MNVINKAAGQIFELRIPEEERGQLGSEQSVEFKLRISKVGLKFLTISFPSSDREYYFTRQGGVMNLRLLGAVVLSPSDMMFRVAFYVYRFARDVLKTFVLNGKEGLSFDLMSSSAIVTGMFVSALSNIFEVVIHERLIVLAALGGLVGDKYRALDTIGSLVDKISANVSRDNQEALPDSTLARIGHFFYNGQICTLSPFTIFSFGPRIYEGNVQHSYNIGTLDIKENHALTALV